jgi:hypothetical protein
MTSAEGVQPPQATPGSGPPAPDEGVTLVGVPLPSEVLQSDPGILTDSVRGSGSSSGATHFQADPEQYR